MLGRRRTRRANIKWVKNALRRILQNPDKTEFMIIWNITQQEYDFQLKFNLIADIDTIRNLGELFAPGLSSKRHNCNVCKAKFLPYSWSEAHCMYISKYR